MAFYDDQDYGVDPNGNPRQRSRISSFSADGNGNFSRTFSGPETGGATMRQEWGADYDEQSRVGADFAGLARRAAAVKQHNAQLGSYSLNAAMKSAMNNGGRLPQNAVDLLSRNLGYDGKNRAVYRAGFLNNGDFAIDVAERGQNGGITSTTMTIPQSDQYRMMMQAPGVWGDEGIAASQRLYQRLSGTLGKSELGDPNAYAAALQSYRSGQSARQAQAAEAQRMQVMGKLVDAAAKAKQRGQTPAEFFKDIATSKVAREWLFSSDIPRYVDSDGNEVAEPFEVGKDNKPVLRQGLTEMRDDTGRILYRELTAEQAYQRAKEIWERDRQTDSAEDAKFSAMIQMLEKMTEPAPLSPQEREIRERQFDDAVDAQRRSEVTRFPQRYLRYRDANGREVVANGYVTNDGRVYDADGREIAGATEARSPYDNALPPIRELGGQQPAQMPASAAQEQGVQTPEQLAQAVLARRRPSAGSPAETPVAAAEQPVEKPAYQQNFEQTVDPATGVADPVRAAEMTPAVPAGAASAQPSASAAQPSADDGFSKLADEMGQDVLDAVRSKHPDWSADSIRAGDHDKEIRRIGQSVRGDEYNAPDYYGQMRKAAYREHIAELERQTDSRRIAMQRELNQKENALAAKVHDLFDADLAKAREWAAENRTSPWWSFGNAEDSYDMSVKKKFGELVAKRMKEQGLHAYDDDVGNALGAKKVKSDFDNYNFQRLIEDVYGMSDIPNLPQPSRGGPQRTRRLSGKSWND